MEMAKHPSSFTNLGHCRLQKKNQFLEESEYLNFAPQVTHKVPLYCEIADSHFGIGTFRSVVTDKCCILYVAYYDMLWW